jgi:predicted nucleic acid-binding protein
MILVDASIWIDHLRTRDEILVTLLSERRVLVHPFVTGEIALGHLHQRELVIRMLQRQAQAAVATHREALQLIDTEKLFGKGIGYVDAHLLASVRLMPGSSLWTRDKRLHEVSSRLGVAANIAR